MMCLSQTTAYAIRALACLENIDRRPCFIRDVAERTGVPKAYLARIINRLARKGIVSAKRGYLGGVALTRPANQVSLLEVVEAVDGEKWIAPCLLMPHECGSKDACPTQSFWDGIRQQIEEKLRQTTLADLVSLPVCHASLVPQAIELLPAGGRRTEKAQGAALRTGCGKPQCRGQAGRNLPCA